MISLSARKLKRVMPFSTSEKAEVGGGNISAIHAEEDFLEVVERLWI